MAANPLGHSDFSRMKYRIDGIEPTVLVVDKFHDLKAHREAFMQYKWGKNVDGIPAIYNVNDFLLRYIIYLDDPGSPANHIPDLTQRKAAVLTKLGVVEVTPIIREIVFQHNSAFNAMRILFLRLQNNESWSILKHSEDELTKLMEQEVALANQKVRVDTIKALQDVITTAKKNFFNGDSTRESEEALMSLIVSDNLGIRVEEWALVLASGGELWPEISILEDGP